MNVGESIERNREFWADVEQMPQEIADRYLAMAEQTPDFQESQQIKFDLEEIANKIALLALRSSDEQMIAPSLKKGVSEKELVLDAEEDNACPPIASEAYKYESKIDVGAKSTYDKYVAIKRETKKQCNGLTNKRAAKIKRHEAKLINKLFINYETEDGERQLPHIAEDPAIFAVQMYDITCAGKGEIEGTDPEISKQLARDMLSSSEHYVADNADRLSQSKDFTQKLLIAYAFDAQNHDRNFIPPTGHILRGYFSSIHSTEQAVDRLEALFDSLLDLYESPSFIAASSEIFTFLPSIFDQVPLIKYFATSNFGAEDETLLRLTALEYLIDRPYRVNGNGSVAFTNIALRLQKLSEKLVSKIDIERAREEFCRIHPNGQEIIDQRLKDKADYDEAIKQEVAQGYYLDMRMYWESFANNHPNSYKVKALLTCNSTLMQRYDEILGASSLDPLVQTVPFCEDFVIDVAVPSKFDIQQKRDFTAAAFAKFDSDSTEYIRLAEVIKSSSGTILGKSYGQAIINDNVNECSTIRPRTLFDDVITPPTHDFDLTGLRTEKPLPGLEAIKLAIEENKIRFVPKRGIEVCIVDSETKNSGLSKIVFKAIGAKHLSVKAVIHARERMFQIKNYEFYDKAGQPMESSIMDENDTFKRYFLNTLSMWMCRPVIETSGGIVQEGKVGPIKGGYFAYLPIKEGKKFQRQDLQWDLCAGEQSEDLDLISEKRSAIDPTDMGRNSTYVSISSEDGEHLPPLKVYL